MSGNSDKGSLPGRGDGQPQGPHAAMVRRLIGVPPDIRQAAIHALSVSAQRTLAESWAVWASPGQYPPEGDWRVWLVRAGRGFGKTRAGAEWVSAIARAMPSARIALVGATIDDVRKVMIEGQSGLLNVMRHGERFTWASAAGELTFASGARAFAYSGENPEKLRGPEHHVAWCDEIAKWRYGDATWDNMTLGLRIGDRPRVMVTTTPRPVKLMRRIMALPDMVETRGSTADNPHLAGSVVAALAEVYGGTRFARQELDGEMIDDVAGALWTRALIDRQRTAALPRTRRIVVGVDPPAGVGGDACGIVAVALGVDDRAYVIDDASVTGASPEGWARAVVDCAHRNRADRVIAEGNQGGAMVRSVLQGANATLPITLVHATHGKVARAEPVAALYESGKAWHLGAFVHLEDELCGLVTGGGYEGPGRSPDRADALVWAMTALMLGQQGIARIKTV